MHSAEAQVPPSLAVCFIAVCFGTRWRTFPARAWRCCPSPAHGSSGASTAAGLWVCGERGQPFTTRPGPSVRAAAPLFTVGGHPGMSLAVLPSSCWGLAKCLSCGVCSCTVRQHIFHSDLCVCQHVLLNSVSPYQARFALWHAVAHGQKSSRPEPSLSPEGSWIYCRVSLLFYLSAAVTKILWIQKPQHLEARWLAIPSFHF